MKLTSQMRSPTWFDAHLLAGEDVTKIDFAAVEANPAAVRHDHAPVVKRIFELVQAAIVAG